MIKIALDEEEYKALIALKDLARNVSLGYVGKAADLEHTVIEDLHYLMIDYISLLEASVESSKEKIVDR